MEWMVDDGVVEVGSFKCGLPTSKRLIVSAMLQVSTLFSRNADEAMLWYLRMRIAQFSLRDVAERSPVLAGSSHFEQRGCRCAMLQQSRHAYVFYFRSSKPMWFRKFTYQVMLAVVAMREKAKRIQKCEVFV